jgi:hypothetical protein
MHDDGIFKNIMKSLESNELIEAMNKNVVCIGNCMECKTETDNKNEM